MIQPISWECEHLSTLRLLRTNAIYQLREIHEAYNSGWPISQDISLTRRYCDALHNIAFVALLADVDAEQFGANLVRAGENWVRLLDRVGEKGGQVPASYNRALLGVMACNAMPLAHAIAAKSSNSLVSPEYDDEFYGAYFIQQYVLSEFGRQPVAPPLTDICQAFEKSLDNMPKTRLEVFQALVYKDAALLGQGLHDLNQAFLEDMEKRANTPSVPPREIQAARHVWLEGLAIIQMGKQAGVVIQPDFDAIPMNATLPLAIRPQNDCILGESFIFD